MTKREIFETLNSLPFDFQICGSLGLKLMGIITRGIGDIDLHVKSVDNDFVFQHTRKGCSFPDGEAISVGGIKIDMWFKWPEYKEITNNFGTYKVSLPDEAMNAKVEWIGTVAKSILKDPDKYRAASLKKHVDDLIAWSEWKNE